MKHYVNQYFTRILLLLCIFTLGGLSQSCSRLYDALEKAADTLEDKTANEYDQYYPQEKGRTLDHADIDQGHYLGFEQSSMFPTAFSDQAASVLNSVIPGTFTPKYPVRQYTITYETRDPKSVAAMGSAVVFVPLNVTGTLPMMLYYHGTQFEDKNAASHGRFDVAKRATSHEDDISIMVAFASEGMIVVVPDQLGFGVSNGAHPYLATDALAQDGIDAIYATKRLFDAERFPGEFDKRLLVTGYSAGGLLAMVTHKKIEKQYPNKFLVNPYIPASFSAGHDFYFMGSAPGSGPYDMAGTMLDTMLSDSDYSAPEFAPYLVESYQQVYGDVYTDREDIYKADYISNAQKFGGAHTSEELSKGLPSKPKNIFTDAFVTELTTEKESSNFYQHLTNNTPWTDDWRPGGATLTMLYAPTDEIVPYQNTEKAYTQFGGEANELVKKIDISVGLPMDHRTAFGGAMIGVKAILTQALPSYNQ